MKKPSEQLQEGDRVRVIQSCEYATVGFIGVTYQKGLYLYIKTPLGECNCNEKWELVEDAVAPVKKVRITHIPSGWEWINRYGATEGTILTCRENPGEYAQPNNPDATLYMSDLSFVEPVGVELTTSSSPKKSEEESEVRNKMQSNFKVGDRVFVIPDITTAPGAGFVQEHKVFWGKETTITSVGSLNGDRTTYRVQGSTWLWSGNQFRLISSANKPMDTIKAGDEIRLKSGLTSTDCGTLNDLLSDGDVARIEADNNQDGDRIYSWTAYDSAGDELESSCCSILADRFEKVTSANKAMANLVKLTKEQKAGLNKDDQALFELGLIDSTLVRTSAGQAYLIDHLWSENKAVLAKQAATEVAEIKAEAAKAV